MKRYKALLMIGNGRTEIQRYAPVNFYSWSHRAQLHYILKRWPDTQWCGDGVPWQQNGCQVTIPVIHKLRRGWGMSPLVGITVGNLQGVARVKFAA